MRGLLGSIVLVAACSFHGTGENVLPDAAVDGSGSSTDAPDEGPPMKQAYRRSVTIDHDNISEELKDFPVYVAMDLPGATAGNTELYFTKKDGMPYPFEVQRWDAANKRVEAWVRATVSKDADTIIIAHYGERGSVPPPATSSGASVFNVMSKYAMVWHLESDTVIDDATGTHPGTPMSLAANAAVPGKLGKGVIFGGGTDVITFDNPLVGNVAHTISVWLDHTSPTADDDVILRVGDGNVAGSRWLMAYWELSSSVSAGYLGANNDVSATPMRDLRNTGKHLIQWVSEGNNKMNRLFIDGVLVDSSTVANAPATTAGVGYVGNSGPNFPPATPGLTGVLDEVRIATVLRSAAWCGVEYVNQNDPMTFFIYGDEELDEPN